MNSGVSHLSLNLALDPKATKRIEGSLDVGGKHTGIQNQFLPSGKNSPYVFNNIAYRLKWGFSLH